jgi:hypothetical protein
VICWIWRKLLGDLFWAFIFQDFPIWYNNKKRFAKIYNMCDSNLFKENCRNGSLGPKYLERLRKNGKGMCKFRFSPSEIEYFNEDKVNFKFFRIFYVHKFFTTFYVHS